MRIRPCSNKKIKMKNTLTFQLCSTNAHGKCRKPRSLLCSDPRTKLPSKRASWEEEVQKNISHRLTIAKASKNVVDNTRIIDDSKHRLGQLAQLVRAPH